MLLIVMIDAYAFLRYAAFRFFAADDAVIRLHASAAFFFAAADTPFALFTLIITYRHSYARFFAIRFIDVMPSADFRLPLI